MKKYFILSGQLGVIFCTVSIVFFAGFHETAACFALPIPAHLPQVEAGLKYANNFFIQTIIKTLLG